MIILRLDQTHSRLGHPNNFGIKLNIRIPAMEIGLLLWTGDDYSVQQTNKKSFLYVGVGGGGCFKNEP